MSGIFSEAWREAQQDAAPTYRELSARTRRTRAPRRCCCGGVIPDGARYVAFAGILDGEFQTSDRHLTWQECAFGPLPAVSA